METNVRNETPPPNQPDKPLNEIFGDMDALKDNFFDAIKVITDDYEMNRLKNSLMYSSYCANRGYGMTMEQLKSIGFKDAEKMEQLYMKSTWTTEKCLRLLKDVEDCKQ